jgi:hypothetical protein
MSDINVGDVVVCVDASPCRLERQAERLIEGRHYRVASVGCTEPDNAERLAVHGKAFEKRPGWCFAFRVTRFRKIDAADEQFTLAMRSCLPIRTEVSA